MNKISAFILDLLFPNRCPVCENIIAFDSFICNNCIAELEKCSINENDVCRGCGKMECICNDKLNYIRTVVCYYYENAAKRGVLSLKDGSKNFGYFLGNILTEKIKEDSILINADYIVPVPMSRKRLKERRYNQAYVIAREISKKTRIPILSNALFKNDSKVQHNLNSEERKMNVSAFFKGNINLDGNKIIICDDVLTTGSTLNKCAELLINMGAAEVYAAVGTTTKLKKE